jgi:hypothetical protein
MHVSKSTRPLGRGGAADNPTSSARHQHWWHLRDPEHKRRRSAVDSLARQAPYLGTEWFDSVFAPQESQA